MAEELIEKKLKWKIVCWAIVVAALIGVGFFIGRKTVKIPKPETIIEYVTLPPIHDTVTCPKPVYVSKPIDTLNIIQQCIADGIYQELWPEKIVEVNNADTTAILADWTTLRAYSEKVFDIDTVGRCEINAEVQYNRLRMVGYNFTPVQKVVTTTVYQQKKYSPFVGLNGAFATDGTRDFLVGAVAGIYVDDKYGINLQYQHSVYDKTSYAGGGILVKF